MRSISGLEELERGSTLLADVLEGEGAAAVAPGASVAAG
jgi:hypothetical protein